jgi:hypothetical protein
MSLHHYREEHGLDVNPLVEVAIEQELTEEGSEPTEVKHGQ